MKEFKSVELLIQSANKSSKEQLKAELNAALADFGGGIKFSDVLMMTTICSTSTCEPEFNNLDKYDFTQAFDLNKGLENFCFAA